jgi:hypothetical protein
MKYLQTIAAEKGFTVSAAGVVDMGQTRPLRASWPGDPARQEIVESNG